MAKTQKFEVQWSYVSSLGGPWGEGDVIELPEDLADAVNRDSPGVLVRHVPKPPKTRQVTRAPQTRGKKKAVSR